MGGPAGLCGPASSDGSAGLGGLTGVGESPTVMGRCAMVRPKYLARVAVSLCRLWLRPVVPVVGLVGLRVKGSQLLIFHR